MKSESLETTVSQTLQGRVASPPLRDKPGSGPPPRGAPSSDSVRPERERGRTSPACWWRRTGARSLIHADRGPAPGRGSPVASLTPPEPPLLSCGSLGGMGGAHVASGTLCTEPGVCTRPPTRGAAVPALHRQDPGRVLAPTARRASPISGLQPPQSSTCPDRVENA